MQAGAALVLAARNQVRSLITPRTRMIIVNSPNNPTGSLLDAADLDALAELTRHQGSQFDAAVVASARALAEAGVMRY